MRSEPRGAWRIACRAAGALVPAVALGGCLIIPTPEHGLISGKGAVDAETLDAFRTGRTTRAEVLLRLGEPAERRGDDRVFVYAWEVACGWFAAGAGYAGVAGPIPKQKYAAIRFDDAGVASDVIVAEGSWLRSATKVLDQWAGPDAPHPKPPPSPSSTPPAAMPAPEQP